MHTIDVRISLIRNVRLLDAYRKKKRRSVLDANVLLLNDDAASRNAKAASCSKYIHYVYLLNDSRFEHGIVSSLLCAQ
jgi:hypothetical protein